MKSRNLTRVLFIVALLAACAPESLLACATCFGKTDSPLAEGMNMGIFSLLGVVLFVLSGFAAFIIFIARRGAAYAAQSAQLSETTKQS
jgi:hypothetical protein